MLSIKTNICDAWNSSLHDMTARGLEEPLLAVSDKHKRLRKVVREGFHHALKQPCLTHKMRNILSKLEGYQDDPRHLVGVGDAEARGFWRTEPKD